MPPNGCENLLYAPITTFRFLRSGRTDINVIIEGTIPVVPGASVLLSQDSRPPWPTGCYSLRYRLANNGTNHDDILIEWFLDDELLDTKHYGSEIYNADGTVIGDGLLPVPWRWASTAASAATTACAPACVTPATTTRSRTSACSSTTARASSAARRARWASRATAARTPRSAGRGVSPRDSKM
jgi:hypothetical protein